MEFVWADETRFADVLSLWQQGFPEDGEEDVRAFWNALRGEARCLLLQEDGDARSMAFVIPATMGKCCVWYIYAAATATAWRGKGYFRTLLEEICRIAAQRGIAGLFLRPGEPSLFAYYARLGFETVFMVGETACKANSLYNGDAVTWHVVTHDAAQTRKRWLMQLGVPAITWSEKATAYALSLLENGGALVSDKGWAMYRREGNRVVITELLCASQDTDIVLESLTRRFACQELRAFHPVQRIENGSAYGMYRAVDDSHTVNNVWYMGFSLE